MCVRVREKGERRKEGEKERERGRGREKERKKETEERSETRGSSYVEGKRQGTAERERNNKGLTCSTPEVQKNSRWNSSFASSRLVPRSE